MPVWLVAVGDCLDVVLGIPGDIRQVSGDVAAASRALALVKSAQSALQAQQRGLNSMLLRNFMASEFDKGQAEFLAGRQAFWKQLAELEAPELLAVFKDQARIAEIRKLATELNQLYDQVLAENEPGMPKYALMVDRHPRCGYAAGHAARRNLRRDQRGHPADGERRFAGGGQPLRGQCHHPGIGRAEAARCCRWRWPSIRRDTSCNAWAASWSRW